MKILIAIIALTFTVNAYASTTCYEIAPGMYKCFPSGKVIYIN